MTDGSLFKTERGTVFTGHEQLQEIQLLFFLSSDFNHLILCRFLQTKHKSNLQGRRAAGKIENNHGFSRPVIGAL
jgi:hypothetical protein